MNKIYRIYAKWSIINENYLNTPISANEALRHCNEINKEYGFKNLCGTGTYEVIDEELFATFLLEFSDQIELLEEVKQ